MVPVKRKYGVARQLEGCHTAVVDGYVIEGHVPADLVHRLLDERPPVSGLSVPGMPIGSPGMEVPGRAPERYQVLAFDANGDVEVYASR
jgi:hypothetical protein